MKEENYYTKKREELRGATDEVEENRYRERLQALAESLIKQRDEAIKYRAASGIERRWREDEETYNSVIMSAGSDMIDYATGEAPARGRSSGPVRSRVVVNILRSKCETAEGRFSDILLPVDDKNWGLKVTPVPELTKGMEDDRPPIDTTTGQTYVNPDGQPVKTSDIARAQVEAAEEAMKGMETEIDDQLTECNFNGECRKVVHDAVVSGTGILKGPGVIKQTRKAWIKKTDETGSTYVMQTVEEHTPKSKRVDYWNIYPDPNCGEDIAKAGYIWEYDEVLPRELKSLIGVEGYLTEQIKAVLKETPYRTQASYTRDKRLEINKVAASDVSTYEKWECCTDINREDLDVLGIDTEDQDGDLLSACVVFVNERPIKIQLNVLDSGGLPYDFFQWCPVKNSIWGIGVVRIGAWAQKVVQAAWRTTMDNARDSSGANIAIGKGIEPVDGRWEITGKKLWKDTGENEADVRKAFAQFQIESRQKELQAIIEMALRFLDMETALPMLFQGEQQEMPETLGATNIVVDSNNVAIRSRVKRWDDQITRPHVARYYYWNMQYNENSDIKGDYNVDARGTSVLLARDQQARTLVQLMGLRGDPKIDNEIDWGKAARELFTSLRLNVLKSDIDKKRDEEARKGQPQQQDPKIQSATIRVQGEMQKAQLVQQSDMAEIQFKAQEAEKQRQFDAQMKQMDLQMKQMEFAQASGMKLSEIKADLAKEASKQNLMRELEDKKATTAELTKPPIEPVGRAKEGMAFQQ